MRVGMVGLVSVTSDAAGLAELMEIDCPRCRRSVQQPFYGPCERCLGELRQRYQAEVGEAEVVEYEPKMNVTPNAVALKDD